MKRIIKNVLLVFVIMYTILNIVLYVVNIVSRNSMFKEIMTTYSSKNSNIEECIKAENDMKEHIDMMKEIYGENAPMTVLLEFEGYIAGVNQIIYSQEAILIATLILSVTIGIILSLTEKSKSKAVVYFIAIGLLLSLLYTIYFHLTRNLPDTKFFEGFLETFIDSISSYGIYYVIIYLLMYIFRYRMDKKNIEELNKEIKKNNR